MVNRRARENRRDRSDAEGGGSNSFLVAAVVTVRDISFVPISNSMWIFIPLNVLPLLPSFITEHLES